MNCRIGKSWKKYPDAHLEALDIEAGAIYPVDVIDGKIYLNDGTFSWVVSKYRFFKTFVISHVPTLVDVFKLGDNK